MSRLSFSRRGSLSLMLAASIAPMRRAAIALLLAAMICVYSFVCVFVLSISTLSAYLILLVVPAILLIWAAPDIKVEWDRIGFPLLLTFIASQIIIPNFYAIPISGVGWMNLRKVIDLSMTAYALLVFGLSQEKRQYLKQVARFNPLILISIFGFFLTIILSLPLSSSISSSMNGLPQVITSWLSVVFVVLSLKIDVQKCRLVLRWMVINCIPLAAICLTERILARRIMFDIMPAALFRELMQNPSFQMLYYANSMRAGAFRAVASFSVPLSTGECGAMILPFGLLLFFYARTRWDRWIGAAGLLSAFTILLTTNARGALFASCIVAAVFIPAYLLERQKSYPVSLVPSLFICWTVASIAALTSTDRFRKTVFGGGATASSNDGRVQQFNMALPHIASRPLWGNGFGTADKVIGFTNGSGYTVDSGFLSVVVDQGLPGLICFVVMIAWPALRSISLFYSQRTLEYDERLLFFVGLSLLAFLVNAFVLSQIENYGLMFLEVALYIGMLGRSASVRSYQQSNASPCDTGLPRAEPIEA